MISIFQFRITSRFFLSFIIIIIISSLLSFAISWKFIQSAVDREIRIRLENSLKGFTQQITSLKNRCKKIAGEIAKDEEILELLKKDDMDSLKRKLQTIYATGIVDLIEIEDINGRVIFRVHNPELSGDIKVDQEIIKTGLSGKNASAYETGKSGFAVRAVSPVFDENRTIGLIMAGCLFSPEFVKDIQLLTGMENGIYKGNNKIISTYEGLDNLDNFSDLLNQEKNTFFKNKMLNASPSFIMIKPLLKNNNKIWGHLVMGINQNEEIKYLQHIRTMIFLFLFAGSIFAFLIYIYMNRSVNSSLETLIRGIENINFEEDYSTIEIKGRDEFSIIAESFNKLIRKINKYNYKIQNLQNDMIKSAKLTTVGQLSAGIAHEIRNPLSSIKMMVQLIRKRYLQNTNQEEVKIVLDEIDRINRLVKDLLEFAKPTPMNFSYCNINNLIKNAISIFTYNISRQGIQISYSLDSSIEDLKIDAEKMTLVFINLIMNSIQAMPDGGNLQISTINNRTDIEIKIQDDGNGIKKTDISEIFEPFYTTKDEGTGLGLALVKLIIERHGGHISVESADKTVFTITLNMNQVN